MSLRRWRAVAFDLDDTLYPEREFVMSGFRAVAEWGERNLGINRTTGFSELLAIYDRGSTGHIFDEWMAVRHLDGGERVGELVRLYREHAPAIKPFPEVPALLRTLKSRYLLGLVSDGFFEVQRRKLDALGLAGWFDATVFSDEWGREAWKPSPRPFQVLLERLGGLQAETVVYVGDNPGKDFLAARRAGMASIQVRRCDGVYAAVVPPTEQHRPDWVLPTLGELPAALHRLQDQV